MAKRRGQAPANGRMLWDGRMWDRQGRQFELARELDRADAKTFLNEGDIQVAIASGTAALQWIEPADWGRAWSEGILPRLHDNTDWRPPPSAPGTLPFVPELWREIDGGRVQRSRLVHAAPRQARPPAWCPRLRSRSCSVIADGGVCPPRRSARSARA